jgi:hypothetical protein
MGVVHFKEANWGNLVLLNLCQPVTIQKATESEARDASIFPGHLSPSFNSSAWVFLSKRRWKLNLKYWSAAPIEDPVENLKQSCIR